MSGNAGSEGDESPSCARARLAVLTVGFVLLGCVVALALSTAVAAQEDDSGEPPAFGNATKGNVTTFELTITDDTDVDETSITAADFELSTGNIDGITVNETGSDAVVEFRLADVVASDAVTVSLDDTGTITDEAGNQLTDANATVTGMDGFRPQLQNFSIVRTNESTATVRVVSSEALSELYVGVGGPGTDTLTMANFTKISTPAQYEVPYEANVTFPEEGEYDLLVGTMIDTNGVTTKFGVERTVLVDHTPPTASIAAPASARVGETVTFSGEPSSDEYGVASYNWSVGENRTATGQSTEFAFDTPGYHGVTLTVTDERGNTDSTTYPILVDAPVTTENVSVEATDVGEVSDGTPNGTVTVVRASTATVGSNRTTGRVRIARDGSLLSSTAVSLESLVVDVPVDTSARLEFASAANLSDWFDTANTTALAGFEVSHERSLPTATFRFSVNRSRLDAAGLSPDDVTLYREADGWRQVYTTKIAENGGEITYEATAAGLSRFVVGGSGGGTAQDDSQQSVDSDGSTGADADGGADDSSGEGAGDGTGEGTDGTGQSPSQSGTASILVTNSTLLTETVDAGDRAVVRAIASNSGNATGTYVVGFVVNNSAVSTTTVTVPAGENRSVTFAEPVEAGGTVVVNGTIAGTLSVEANQSDGAATTASGGGLPIPNPLALWPGGFVGRALGAVFWFAVILYGVLKGLALYLGY